MKVGSLVECIRDSFYDTDDIHPILNKIYTVRSISENLGVGLAFEEILNKKKLQPYGLFEELHFNVNRFRELLPPIANIEEHINENTLEPVTT